MYFMLILVSGAKMQLPLQLGVTDRQTDSVTDSTTTVTLCACALRVNKARKSIGTILELIEEFPPISAMIFGPTHNYIMRLYNLSGKVV